MTDLQYTKKGNKVQLKLSDKIHFSIELDSRESEIILTIFLYLLRDNQGKKLLLQKEIGEIVGYSRQTTNYTIKDYKEGGFGQALTRRENSSDVFTSEVKQSLKEIWLCNPLLQPKEIKKKLCEIYPHLKEDNLTTEHLYYHMNQLVNFKELISSLQKHFKVNKQGLFERDAADLIKRLMELLVKEESSDRKIELEKLKSIFSLEGIYEKVIKSKREKLFEQFGKFKKK